MKKVLFICKANYNYCDHGTVHRSSGLYNSTKFVSDALNVRGAETRVVIVQDNNCIDREVNAFNPDYVIIEALWVVPEKFDVLKSLHPAVEWFVHIHSNIPFLAQEGIAIEWIREYHHKHVKIIVNCKRAKEAINSAIYLPNIYDKKPSVKKRVRLDNGMLYVGCFGAIRPMKNQLTQAMAAIQYAKDTGRVLVFSMNTSRIENGGESVLKSIRALFKKTHNCLQEINWLDHAGFKKQISQQDINLQCSMSETFNIVTADAVSEGVPVVVSPEISWVSRFNQADPSSVKEIKRTMAFVEDNAALAYWNRKKLNSFINSATNKWMDFIK